jgi:alpha-glucosidase
VRNLDDGTSTDRDWWRTAVVYEIYVRSFADSKGDGIGDLRGIASRLDHLVSLGVDAVWLTPFYRSPLVDGGYDVADHRNVDPRFGTLADFDDLLARCHASGIRVFVDIVLNHTSSAHPWFRAALLAGPGSAERERYIFRDGRGPDGSEPPTDWQSWFRTSAWQRVDDGQWYLHLFDPSQVDLNWAHPEVREDAVRTLRFWADRGVDGFRVDVAHGMAKDLDPLRDDGGRYPWRRHELVDGTHPLYARDEVHEIFREWRTVFDEYEPPRAAVAEAVEGSRRTLYARPDELGQSFTFDLALLDWDIDRWRETVADCLQDAKAAGSTCTWVLPNHDVVRHATRFALPEGTDLEEWKLRLGRDPVPNLGLGLRRARALTLLVLALPGSAYLYQGEELGLFEVADLPRELLDNPMWERSGHTQVGSDGCRVPLPWTTTGPSLGFSTGPGWLPQPAEFADLAVAAQAADPDSTLSMYRSGLALRRGFARNEDYRLVTAEPALFVIERPGGWRSWTNFGPAAVAAPPHVVLSSGPLVDDRLPPDTTAWWQHVKPDNS